MAEARKHDYPMGIPLRPPPGWRGGNVSASPPALVEALAPPRPRARPRKSGNELAVKVGLVVVMVLVCMGVGWLAVAGSRRSEAKRPRVKSSAASPVAKKTTPRDESRPQASPMPEPLLPDNAKKPPPPIPVPVVPDPPKTPAGSVLTYEQHILPIMERSCLRCHSRAKQRGGLDLSTFAALMQGGETSKGVLAGKPSDSPIYETIHTGKMPPGGKKLPERDLRMIREWILGGARSTRTR